MKKNKKILSLLLALIIGVFAAMPVYAEDIKQLPDEYINKLGTITLTSTTASNYIPDQNASHTVPIWLASYDPIKGITLMNDGASQGLVFYSPMVATPKNVAEHFLANSAPNYQLTKHVPNNFYWVEAIVSVPDTYLDKDLEEPNVLVNSKVYGLLLIVDEKYETVTINHHYPLTKDDVITETTTQQWDKNGAILTSTNVPKEWLAEKGGFNVDKITVAQSYIDKELIIGEKIPNGYLVDIFYRKTATSSIPAETTQNNNVAKPPTTTQPNNNAFAPSGNNVAQKPVKDLPDTAAASGFSK